MNENKTQALIYCRVSSQKQATEGSGLESQEQRCREYADLKGYQTEAVFKDSFTGGGDFMNRPAMSSLIKYLDNHKYKKYTVVFDDLKRFARDTEFHLKLRTAFKARNATPECLNFKFEDSPEGRFVETILAAGGELERNQNKRQVVQKMKARLENGYWTFGAPAGYVMKHKDPVHGTILEYGESKTVSLLKQALEGFANGRFRNQLDVKEFLQENNYCGKKRVGLNFIKNLLTNIILTGYIEYPNWEVSRRLGHHKGIITLETYQKNQDKLFRKAKIITRKDMREDFPLRGFVICSACLLPYTASWSKGKKEKHPYYHCATKGCIAYGKSVKRLDLENEYKITLKKLRPKLIAVTYTKARLLSAWNQKLKGLESSKLSLQKNIDDNDIQIGLLAARAAASLNPIIAKAYEKEIEKLAEENKKQQEKLEKMAYLKPDFGTALEEVLSFINTPCDTWVNGDLEIKNTISNMVFHSKPSYDRKSGFGTPDFSIAIKLFEQFNTTNYLDVHIPANTWNTFEEYIYYWYPHIIGRGLMSRTSNL
jgi:DNA invertase Pin-like site-specific DNA recombinase